MISTRLFSRLHAEGLVSQPSLERIRTRNGLFPIRRELQAALYLGVLLLSSGIGILIYKNIEIIGHRPVIGMIALLCAACFFYCTKKKLPFSRGKVASPNDLFDYILLLGCLLFITVIAYLQYQYNLFGNRYSIATLLPMLLLFFSAYYYDHLGVLSMAITSFAAWMGLTVTPLRILRDNNFNDGRLIITTVGVGIILLLAGLLTKRKKFKVHFEFTYTNFGTHILFIGLLAGMFHFDATFFAWFLAAAAFGAYCYRKGLRENSFYFILITVLYVFVGLSYVILRSFYLLDWEWGALYLSLAYFIVASVLLVIFLIRTAKKMQDK